MQVSWVLLHDYRQHLGKNYQYLNFISFILGLSGNGRTRECFGRLDVLRLGFGLVLGGKAVRSLFALEEVSGLV